MLTTLLLSVLSLMPTQADAADHPPTGNQPATIEVEVNETRSLDYLIALPEGYDAEGDAVPLMLFLHGAGERGDNLDRVKSWGPPKMIEDGHDFGAIVISPQCPSDTWWTDHLDLLVALLDEIEEKYNVDDDRIYVTGISMGGYGTFALAARQPDRFAAMIPICGGGVYFDALRLTRLPMWVFHGEDDRVVPVEESRRMVEIANSRGGEHARLTVYPDTGHNSWSAAYGSEETWAWLFDQER